MVKGSPQSPGRIVFMTFLVLFYFLLFLVLVCIVSLLYDVFVLWPGLCDIFHTLIMARYSLLMLKVPLSTSQLTN